MCFENVSFVLGNEEIVRNMKNMKPLDVFDKRTVRFLSALSDEVISGTDRNSEARGFAFWIRKNSLDAMRAEYENLNRKGLGTSFHICPSNMPLVFAFSLASALLAGNSVIVKLSSRDNPFESIIADAISKAEEKTGFRDRIAIIRYPNERKTTKYLQSISQSRVVWGSDETIDEIRSIPSDTRDVFFKNRYSMSLILSRRFNESDRKDVFLKDFYSDTYAYDQNACSSPRIVFWMGEPGENMKARKTFYEILEKQIRENGYETEGNILINKLSHAYLIASEYEGTDLDVRNNLMMTALVKNPDSRIWDMTYPAGLFVNIDIENMEKMNDLLTESIQTVTVFDLKTEDFDRIKKADRKDRIKRIVPFGQAASFSLYWDGINIIEEMSTD